MLRRLLAHTYFNVSVELCRRTPDWVVNRRRASVVTVCVVCMICAAFEATAAADLKKTRVWEIVGGRKLVSYTALSAAL